MSKDEASRKLEELLAGFQAESDKDHGYFDENIAWIGKMIISYADKAGVTVDEMVEAMEKDRSFWWPNYYQRSNFPDVDSPHFRGIFKSVDDLKKYAKEHWIGFICPSCHSVIKASSECPHCEWKAYGFLQSPDVVFVFHEGAFVYIHIFEPIPNADDLVEAAE